MIIALDYDRTYTRDIGFWDRFMVAAQLAGHSVICITNRPWLPTTELLPTCPCYAAGDQFKREYALSLGIHVDIWIDDEPGSICEPASLP